MAQATQDPRLKQRYETDLRPQLQRELGLSNVMQVPRLEKIVLNCGVGLATEQKSLLDGAVADLTVITSDNPRSEDPLAIIAEIEPGAREGGGRYVVEPDRRLAIRQALAEARAGDAVVIAGKGHEKYQVIGDRTLAFDDVEVARAALARRRSGSRVT